MTTPIPNLTTCEASDGSIAKLVRSVVDDAGSVVVEFWEVAARGGHLVMTPNEDGTRSGRFWAGTLTGAMNAAGVTMLTPRRNA